MRTDFPLMNGWLKLDDLTILSLMMLWLHAAMPRVIRYRPPVLKYLSSMLEVPPSQ